MVPLMLSRSMQHWLEDVTHRMGPPHSCSDIMVSPAVPTTPTTPRGASSRGRREAVAAWPAAAVAVVASRAKPPERRREESDIYSEIFQNIKIRK